MSKSDESKARLRSQDWFGAEGLLGFGHRSWMKNQGYPDDLFDGRPVIGICNTWSETNPCNGHLRELADHVKRGVYEAGGFPLEFPVISLGEPVIRPTAMLLRNLASIDVEESIRANPLDGVVLMTGCDKTTPALLMGAASCDLPTIALSGGPMLNGKFEGADIGCGTCMWRFRDQVRSGEMTNTQLTEAEAAMARSAGHCNTMGTASTMNCLVEALGMSLPQNGAIPAVDSRRQRMAQLTGRHIVAMVRNQTRISQILTRDAFLNAIVANAALGGSTNAVIHLMALAGRLDVQLTLDDWDLMSREVPCIVNLQPSGRFLMEDFYYAGGMPAVLHRIMHKLRGEAITVTGQSLAEYCAGAECHNDDVIRPLANPVSAQGGVAVLRGNLCPDGAVLKLSAASPELYQHRGQAIVFDNADTMNEKIDDPALEVTPDHILVLQNCGPIGYPGMPELGNMPLPEQIIKRGVTDMIRISDARMSGTAYGTVVLHVAPEAAAGGVLGLVRTGDWICLDIAKRTLQLEVDDAELAQRRATWKKPQGLHEKRGWYKLYRERTLQADKGADFDFLVGRDDAQVHGDNV